MAEQNAPEHPEPKRSSTHYLLAALPLIVFLSLAAIFYKQLSSGVDPSKLPSVLIGKPAPSLPTAPLTGLIVDGKQFPTPTPQVEKGKVTVVNVWASWCVPCRAEHPIITRMKEERDITLIGINYKDKNPNALKFINTLGNPFDSIGIDPNGATSIDWGVYGIPETFIVGKDGLIAYKHVGPINEALLLGKIYPAIDAELAK